MSPFMWVLQHLCCETYGCFLGHYHRNDKEVTNLNLNTIYIIKNISEDFFVIFLFLGYLIWNRLENPCLSLLVKLASWLAFLPIAGSHAFDSRQINLNLIEISWEGLELCPLKQGLLLLKYAVGLQKSRPYI